MKRDWLVPFINVGHFLDHFVMLVYATAVLTLVREWNTPYSEMIKLATGGFIAFGAFAIPAGWLADHWSRYRMMVVFFFGIGGALFLTGFANAPCAPRRGAGRRTGRPRPSGRLRGPGGASRCGPGRRRRPPAGRR
jgi:MFS family permease